MAPDKKKASQPASKGSKKSVRVKVNTLYKIEGNKAIKRKECPKCGAGVFLADHKDRMTCGKCGYTEFKK